MSFELIQNDQLVELAVVLCANVFNLMIVTIFLQRSQGRGRVDIRFALKEIVLVVVLSLATIYNWMNERGVWMVLLTGLMVIFLLFELLLDYILKLKFRQTRKLGPYLFQFYASQIGLIGYAFLSNQIFGFITLTTYFLSLNATAYSCRKVGHGSL